LIQMIVQYEVKQNLLSQYQDSIEKISTMLADFEADTFSCIQSEERNFFVESFFVPTEAHYHALKKMRQSRNHSVFGILEEYVPGGLERMGFMAIKQKR
jgi:hypothetical protein